MENISQSTERISQTGDLSAKAQRESAKLGKYQPKYRENQPNLDLNISQSSERESAKLGISQTWKISAKVRENQPNLENISQSTEKIREYPNLVSAKLSQSSERESAKLGKYQKYRENHQPKQPKLRGYQPNLENISQSTEGISQTWKISAKAQR
ncbi:hypothetical protein [Niallia sp. FSL K6-0077]|uniref:hypothetical protein n=1 Tax=Niallia sp. FSL K6-0077 TaxID=2954743 RepID=UPI0030F50E66